MYNFVDDNEEFNSKYYKDLLDKSESRDLGGLESLDQPKEEVHPEQFIPDVDDSAWEDAEVINDTSDPVSIIRSTNGKTKDFGSKVDTMLTITPNAQVDVANTFKELFNELNTTYGLDIRFDFDSFTKTLSYLIAPKSQKAIELYLSEGYGRVRAALYVQYLNAISLLSQQILDPKFLSSNSMSMQDKLILMRELFTYLKSLDEIYEKVKVEDTDVRLRQLAAEDNSDGDLNNKEVQDFLEGLMNSIRGKDSDKE